jgi:hypothetical protein
MTSIIMHLSFRDIVTYNMNILSFEANLLLTRQTMWYYVTMKRGRATIVAV